MCFRRFNTVNRKSIVNLISSRMNMKLSFPVLLLLLLVNLYGVLGQKCKGEKCKVNEQSSLPVDLPRLCGDNIMIYFDSICNSVWFKRKRGKYCVLFLPYLLSRFRCIGRNCLTWNPAEPSRGGGGWHGEIPYKSDGILDGNFGVGWVGWGNPI